MIYLYLKSHNKTGLKYLGKTTQNPFKYKGSGKHWKAHLKIHGNDVTTKILYSCEDKEEFRLVAKKFSNLYNIVESNEFANLAPEEGQGGYTSYNSKRNKKISEALKGRKNTWVKKGTNKGKVLAINTITNCVESVTKEEFSSGNYVGAGVSNKGKKYSKRKKKTTRVDSVVTCPHCNMSGAKNNMTRYHFDNCKK